MIVKIVKVTAENRLCFREGIQKMLNMKEIDILLYGRWEDDSMIQIISPFRKK